MDHTPTSQTGGETAPPDAADAPTRPPGSKPRRRLRLVVVILVAAGLVFGLMQLVPYRVDNPAVRQEPSWDSANTRRLAVAACFDCHSNETSTYWWEDVAPVSWWITNHVKEGRSALNFSDCTRGGAENEASETVREGSMPPDYYTWFGLHSDAKMTPAERAQLAQGLAATLSGWNCGSGGD
jgi:hypothetical protein